MSSQPPYPVQAVRHSDYMYETHTHTPQPSSPSALVSADPSKAQAHTRGETHGTVEAKKASTMEDGKIKKNSGPDRERLKRVSGHGIKIDGTP